MTQDTKPMRRASIAPKRGYASATPAPTTATRRRFLAGAAASLALPYLARPVTAAEPGRSLPIPPVIEASGDPSELVAHEAISRFLDGASTPTLGFSQSYLGPVLRLRKGSEARINVANRLGFPITCHWHGLHVPAIVDGGPQLEIMPGATWQADLPIDQPARVRRPEFLETASKSY